MTKSSIDNRSIFQLSRVRTILGIGIFLIFLSSGLAIADFIDSQDKLVLEVKKEAVTVKALVFFLTHMLQVPVALATGTIAIIGIFSLEHRSKQTREQINVSLNQIELARIQVDATREQNNFTNYFKHLEEFSKNAESFFNEISGRKSSIMQIRRLYRMMYPNSKKGDIDQVSKHYRNRLERCSKQILEQMYLEQDGQRLNFSSLHRQLLELSAAEVRRTDYNFHGKQGYIEAIDYEFSVEMLKFILHAVSLSEPDFYKRAPNTKQLVNALEDFNENHELQHRLMYQDLPPIELPKDVIQI